jgi:hypothetical protein
MLTSCGKKNRIECWEWGEEKKLDTGRKENVGSGVRM